MQPVISVYVVRDYLAWSIINLFCGWGILGCIPLICSLQCRTYKSANDYNQAEWWSRWALIANISVTIGGLIIWIIFIIIMVVFVAFAAAVSHLDTSTPFWPGQLALVQK